MARAISLDSGEINLTIQETGQGSNRNGISGMEFSGNQNSFRFPASINLALSKGELAIQA